MNANQLSVITMQNKDNDLKVQGMDQGLSLHSPTRIGRAIIVNRAFIIGYEISIANLRTLPWLEKSDKPIVREIKYATKMIFPTTLASNTLLLSLL
jgi:hypothetical protein